MNCNTENEERILKLLKESIPPKYVRNGIKREMTLHADLGMDSMAIASLAFRAEEELNVNFNELIERVADFKTVDDVLSIIGKMTDSECLRESTRG